MSSKKYYRAEDIDHIELSNCREYYGLAIVYKNSSGLINHFHPCKNIWDLFEFVTKYFAKTAIKLENPHRLASGKSIDQVKFKKLKEIVDNI